MNNTLAKKKPSITNNRVHLLPDWQLSETWSSNKGGFIMSAIIDKVLF